VQTEQWTATKRDNHRNKYTKIMRLLRRLRTGQLGKALTTRTRTEQQLRNRL